MIYAMRAATARLPFGDPELWDYSPWQYHLCCFFSNLLVYIFLTGVFILYDATARRRFCRKRFEETHRFSEHLGILRSWEFLSHAAGFALLPLLFGMDQLRHPLYFLFPIEKMGKFELYFSYLLCVFPLMLLVDFGFRMRTRTFWRTLPDEEAEAFSFDLLKLVVLWVMVAVGFSLLAPLYLIVIPFFIAVFVRWLRSPIFWIVASILLVLITLGRRLRAIHRQRRFLHKLKKYCKGASIALSPIRHPHRSIFSYDAKPNFTLSMGGKTYAVKIFPALSKDAEMVFLDEEMGYFKRSIRIRRNELFSSRRRFRYAFESEGAEHKILLVLPAPQIIQLADTQKAFSEKNTTYFRESGRFQKLYDASRVFDMTLYSGQAFLNALDRNALHLSEKENE